MAVPKLKVYGTMETEYQLVRNVQLVLCEIGDEARQIVDLLEPRHEETPCADRYAQVLRLATNMVSRCSTAVEILQFEEPPFQHQQVAPVHLHVDADRLGSDRSRMPPPGEGELELPPEPAPVYGRSRRYP
jgi:hypothetical protein